MCASYSYYVAVSVTQESEPNLRSFKNGLEFWAGRGNI